MAKDNGRDVWVNATAPRYEFDLGCAQVDYGVEGPLVRPNEPKTVRVTFYNCSKTQLNLSLNWLTPEGWMVTPRNGYCTHTHWPAPVFEFVFTLPVVDRSTLRAVLEVTIDGRPSAMLVPLVLLNGNLYPC